MKQRSLRKVVGLFAAVGLLLAACGEADDDDDAGDGTEEEAGGGEEGGAADFQACLVTDTGGVDDNSFNELGYMGITQAEDELGIEGNYLESQSDADFDPNIQTFIDQGCELIVTQGFLLGDATRPRPRPTPIRGSPSSTSTSSTSTPVRTSHSTTSVS